MEKGRFNTVSTNCPYPQPEQSSRRNPSYSLKIHFNNILLQDSPSKPCMHTTNSYHSSRYDHPNNIWWKPKIIQLLIMQFPPVCYLVLLKPKSLTLFSDSSANVPLSNVLHLLHANEVRGAEAFLQSWRLLT